MYNLENILEITACKKKKKEEGGGGEGKNEKKEKERHLSKMERQQKVKENHFFGMYFICQALFSSLDMMP